MILNKKHILLACTAAMISTPAQASMFDTSAFVDKFDDGIVNTNIYSPIGNAIINESNGLMTVQGSVFEGVSISFDSVVSESNWMGFEFETRDFTSSQGFSIAVIEKNILDQEFTSLLINFEPVLSEETSGVSTNQVKKDLKGTYTIFDDQGNQVAMKMDTWKRKLEVPANSTWKLYVDWVDLNGKDTWIIDSQEPPLPDNLKKVILQNVGLLAKKKGKRVHFTVTSGNDPLFIFNQVAADPTPQHIPEPTSILSLLALGTLGAASTLNRKLKPSKSSEKETTKVG